VLPILATVLRGHDRELASRAAESMVRVLDGLEASDLGAQEILPTEVESLLRGLGGIASDGQLSADVRAQAVEAAGALARITGASLAVPRAALEDEDTALRRAAVASLSGSAEPEDLSALTAAVEEGRDVTLVSHAAAAVCEATAGVGRPLPAPIEDRIRRLLRDQNARPSVVGPVLACLARAPGDGVAELRRLARAHPNEATRAAWQALASGVAR
jgi:hypothetical protein